MFRVEGGKMNVLLYVCRYSYRKAITVSLDSNCQSGSGPQATELTVFRVLVKLPSYSRN